MPIKTLPEDQLVTMSQTVVKEVAKAFAFPYYVNDLTHDANFDTDHTATKLEFELTLLNDPDLDRTISFYSNADADPIMGGAASAQVTVAAGITFIYLNDGYKDSYLIIIHDGKVVQNLKLEQQILSGPEVENLIEHVIPNAK
ncbi:hypothetical protein BVJ53_03400 [Lacticaseibacillus chiayiensis]|uniref:Uncharacterized protein n=1 Tax=Lacticaseibacillus chiayiensis TaxID=2100821 RepID=A0A4Q1UAC2_9LACO|nr:hypothetical protein [Lacticaseibacillus chiayiensis]QVI34401.1 hypothetical protein KG086_11575 [Lacticaseibacillus chiayiensis]RXT27825.1 hypothetical protein BVJ53_03400 [Lacticaseibacillus chiayiensis]RXT58745.1 hypothetical protein CHT97_04360 [Lacticaseibacillus chiayiensis]UYN56137.1 hypothetical protein OFW50_11810 [Lacticaseibacillus chiayiensis]